MFAICNPLAITKRHKTTNLSSVSLLLLLNSQFSLSSATAHIIILRDFCVYFGFFLHLSLSLIVLRTLLCLRVFFLHLRRYISIFACLICFCLQHWITSRKTIANSHLTVETFKETKTPKEKHLKLKSQYIVYVRYLHTQGANRNRNKNFKSTASHFVVSFVVMSAQHFVNAHNWCYMSSLVLDFY